MIPEEEIQKALDEFIGTSVNPIFKLFSQTAFRAGVKFADEHLIKRVTEGLKFLKK